MTEIDALWVHLSATPLTWLTATLIAYLTGLAVFRASGDRTLAKPVVIAVALPAAALAATATPHGRDFEGAQFVHFMLGPAAVALAAPLWFNRAAHRRLAAPLAAGLGAGSAVAAISAILIADALGAAPETVLSLAPKSATAPIAMGVSEGIGGAPALTAALVVLTGVFGAVAGPGALTLFRVKRTEARGLALGVACYGIGAARAFRETERGGAFAGAAMALNGLPTALIVPLIVAWLL